MHKEEKLTLKEGIQIQQDQLKEYKFILNEDTYKLLERYCKFKNNQLIEEKCNDGFKVFRGSDMSSLVKNHAIALTGKGGELINNRLKKIVFFLTIVDLSTMSTINAKVEDRDMNTRVDKLLGGWENLMSGSTCDRDIDDINYQECGTTKDKKFAYSILRCNDTLVEI